MIKANELRINKTFIEVSGKYVTPSHLKENHFCWVVGATEQGKEIYNPYLPYTDERVKPILLTEEMLLKCGFLCDGEDNVMVLPNGDSSELHIERELFSNNYNAFVTRGVSKGVPGKDYDYVYLRSVQYLHQLQNLYFALTGEELEIIPSNLA